MGLERLRLFLARHSRVALDTCVFIYQLEANPRYLPLTDPLFARLEGPGVEAVTSTITMTELLVQPHREPTDARATAIYALLSTYPHLTWIAPDLEVADLAARLRATHGLRTPDALQAATGLRGGATAFVTNDKAFQRITGIETLLLDSLL